MEKNEPLMLEVLEQLKSMREDNSRFANDVNRGFHSVHARLDAIEQDRDRQGSRQYQGIHANQSVNLGTLSDQLIYDDPTSRVLPSPRQGRRVVPDHLVSDLTDQQRTQLISNLCNEAYYGPGPVAESDNNDGLVKVKQGKLGMSFNIGSVRSRKPIPQTDTKRERSFFQLVMGAEEMFENDPAIKAGLVDENGVEIDRSGGYKSGKDAVQRNACMQFLHDIASTPIHPNSTLRTRWDLMILMLLLYVCITAPVMVCFEITLDQWGGLWWWENVVNGIFIVDIFLNMNTAFYDAEDNLVTRRKLIFLAYLYSWMIVDVIAVLPYEYMTDAGESSADEAATLAKGLKLTKFTRILRVLRVIKLLRVLKVPALLKRFEGAAGYGIMKFLTILGGAILMNHLVACVFYYCAHLRMGDDLVKILNTTNVTYGHFVTVMSNGTGVEGFVFDEQELQSMKELQYSAWNQTWVYNAGLEDDTPVERYITALYWGMSTLTTVGYGDVTPMNSAEKICSMLAMVIGVTVFAYFMGTTAALITSMNSTDNAKTRKIGEMDTFLRARHVPPSMAEKIRKFYSKAVQHHLIDNQDMVSQLSMPLRTELLLFLYRNTLEKVPFFKGKDPQFITALVAKLRMEYYAEGDIVIHEGDLGNVMYFVVKGNLEARQYIWDDGGQPEVKADFDIGPRDEETGKNDAFEKIEKIRAKLLPRRTSSKAEIQAFMEKRPEEFGFYSNVRELKKKFRLVGDLHDGEHFGEYSCLLGQHRTSTIVSLDFSELYSLSRDDLMEVYKMWPELHKEFLHLIKQFQEMTGMEVTDEEFEQNYGASRPQQRFSMDVAPGSGSSRQMLPPLQEDEPSLHGPQSPQNDLNMPSAAEGSAGADSERERDQVSMKKAVQLIMNTKKFDKLASNPVFQLLSEGQDLRGVREKSSSDRGEERSRSLDAVAEDLPSSEEHKKQKKLSLL